MLIQVPLRYEQGRFVPLAELPAMEEGQVIHVTWEGDSPIQQRGVSAARLLASAQNLPRHLSQPNETASQSREILETEFADYLLERLKES
jgi:hypothetical protein